MIPKVDFYHDGRMIVIADPLGMSKPDRLESLSKKKIIQIVRQLLLELDYERDQKEFAQNMLCRAIDSKRAGQINDQN